MGRRKTRDGILAVDPFDVSTRPTPAQVAWAKWFVNITKDIDGRYHIRRIHYKILGESKPDGRRYENTNNDGALLGRASEYARYLGLVDFDRIVDHKNEGETVRTTYEPDTVPTDLEIGPAPLTCDEIEDMDDVISIWSSTEAIQFDVQMRQPYHLEIWIEKSTMNDILVPIAERYGATLMVASGQFSLTNAKDAFVRIKNLEKPIRIFYVRDFDPAGETMAKAVSRKLEWFVRTQKPQIDLKLIDVALTADQCVKYQLPRSPMDRKEKYKNNFEKKYGEGATELDSLEALHPGELAKIIIEAIDPYFEHELYQKVKRFQEDESRRYRQHKEDLITGVIEENEPRLRPLIERYNSFIAKANAIGSEIGEIIGAANMNYDFEPRFPEESNNVVEERTEHFLLDTTLSYELQLEKYQGMPK